MKTTGKGKNLLSSSSNENESLWIELSNCLEQGGKKLTDSAIALNKRFECRH
ncbi:MAG: hypothetical protein V1494_05605 [Candidatus Diapherotrites archaeon]